MPVDTGSKAENIARFPATTSRGHDCDNTGSRIEVIKEKLEQLTQYFISALDETTLYRNLQVDMCKQNLQNMTCSFVTHNVGHDSVD